MEKYRISCQNVTENFRKRSPSNSTKSPVLLIVPPTMSFASLAEFERDLIRERTQAGLKAARARGRKGGRPKGLSEKAKATAAAAETLYRRGEHSTQQMAAMLSISKSTLYAYLRYQEVEIGSHDGKKTDESSPSVDSVTQADDVPRPQKKTPTADKSSGFDGFVVFEMKITLLGVTPAIWRRFRVRSNITLHQVHLVLQAVMGWTDSHLYEFSLGHLRPGQAVFARQTYGAGETMNTETTLDEVIYEDGQAFFYTYDFGDNWEHEIVIEKIITPRTGVKGMKDPMCVAGSHACPPEDCGGVFGHERIDEFLATGVDPDGEDANEFAE